MESKPRPLPNTSPKSRVSRRGSSASETSPSNRPTPGCGLRNAAILDIECRACRHVRQRQRAGRARPGRVELIVRLAAVDQSPCNRSPEHVPRSSAAKRMRMCEWLSVALPVQSPLALICTCWTAPATVRCACPSRWARSPVAPRPASRRPAAGRGSAMQRWQRSADRSRYRPGTDGRRRIRCRDRRRALTRIGAGRAVLILVRGSRPIQPIEPRRDTTFGQVRRGDGELPTQGLAACFDRQGIRRGRGLDAHAAQRVPKKIALSASTSTLSRPGPSPPAPPPHAVPSRSRPAPVHDRRCANLFGNVPGILSPNASVAARASRRRPGRRKRARMILPRLTRRSLLSRAGQRKMQRQPGFGGFVQRRRQAKRKAGERRVHIERLRRLVRSWGWLIAKLMSKGLRPLAALPSHAAKDSPARVRPANNHPSAEPRSLCPGRYWLRRWPSRARRAGREKSPRGGLR